MSYYANYRMGVDRSNKSVPPRIKCNRCDIVKNPDAFSSKSLGDLVEKIAADAKKRKTFNAQVQTWIPCGACTPQQIVELECFYCGITKDKEKFSKQQRKNPDRAKCWECMQETANMEPGGDSDDEGTLSGASDGSLSDDDDDDDDMSTITGGTRSLALSSAGTYAAPGSSTMGSSGGVSLAGLGSSGGNSSRTTNNSSNLSSTMSQGYSSVARSSMANSAAANCSVAPSARSVAGNRAAGSTSGRNQNPLSDGKKFAKIPAVKKKITYDVAAQPEKAAAAKDDEDEDEREIQSEEDSD